MNTKSAICVVDGCDEWAVSLELCNAHYLKLRKYGDPKYQAPRGGQSHPQWRGDDVGYQAVHDRVKAALGLASNYNCFRCGRAAKQWAYDNADPNQLIDQRCGPYSLDIHRYRPMCVPCHKRKDLAPLIAAGRWPPKHTPETIEKMRVAQSQPRPHMRGKPKSEEHKAKISAAQKGVPRKPWTPEQHALHPWVHGTYVTANRERRHGMEMCAPCRQARLEYLRAWKLKKKSSQAEA